MAWLAIYNATKEEKNRLGREKRAEDKAKAESILEKAEGDRSEIDVAWLDSYNATRDEKNSKEREERATKKDESTIDSEILSPLAISLWKRCIDVTKVEEIKLNMFEDVCERSICETYLQKFGPSLLAARLMAETRSIDKESLTRTITVQNELGIKAGILDGCVAIGLIKVGSQIEGTNLMIGDKILTMNGNSYGSYEEGMQLIRQSIAKSNEVTLGF